MARSAQVSPKLISRYFGGKDGLFLAANDVRFDLAAAFDGPQSSFGGGSRAASSRAGPSSA